MKTYLATFVPGFAEVVTTRLAQEDSSMEVITVKEAHVAFQSNKDYSWLAMRKYFNSVFLVVSFLETTEQKSDPSIVKQLHRTAQYQQIRSHLQGKTFRLMVQKGSKLIHITKEITKAITTTVTQKTGLSLSPLKSDTEVWLMIRNEGDAYLGVKYSVTGPFDYHKSMKGELQPRIAHLLNLLSDPTSEDVYVDPFAGYGALPIDRAITFPYKQIYLSDNDPAQGKNLKQKIQRFKNIIVHTAEATSLQYLEDASVNRIVTDPPWGFFDQQNVDFIRFYTKLLSEFARVAMPAAVVVILTARSEEMTEVLSQQTDFTLEAGFSTLVNGKKAHVYKLHRN